MDGYDADSRLLNVPDLQLDYFILNFKRRYKDLIMIMS